MKWSTGTLFCEQVGELTRVFSQWNVCEQTVVLYALLRRLPAVQARFLEHAIEHSLHAVSELDTLELNANNPVFIRSLLTESTDIAINQLLTHLPLLRLGNIECKQRYLSAIPELISHCVSTGQFTEQAQQLLSYILIHPAITSQERRSLTQWLRHLEERITGTGIHNLEEYTNTTISLTPPDASAHHLEVVDRTNNANNSTRHKPRSFSISIDHTNSLIGLSPLSPSSCASSGSESRLDENYNRTLESGMRDVPSWLKTLRLHKYSCLFANLNYEEMLQLTEDQLAEQGVTKGARHKLALSISKLQQRYTTLANLEKDLLQQTRNGTQSTSFSQGPLLLVSILDELKVILATPLKPSQDSDPQDIPAQFTKVLGKLCSRLALDSVDDGILCACINVLEKVLQHDCFTPHQKEKVQQWRSRLGNPRPALKWHANYGYNNRRFSNLQQHNRKPNLNLNHVHNAHSHNSFPVTPHRNSISTPYIQNNQIQAMNQNNLRPIRTAEKRPSLQENSIEQLQRTLQRTYSAPRDHFLGQRGNGGTGENGGNNRPETTEPEINLSLETLCLRMTEQALDGFGEA
ncbi:hypothetical protein M0802_010574 [Mischocyttarus mexicanus]|nr:hypothetical protein M0802_010574 [Mischocyttarus mexicanus]